MPAGAAPAGAGAGPSSAAGPSAGPVPRLMILKMAVENFKSYGGIKEIGPFHKSFSSVVGPNGSGKSNVIDAMLFVFGKKSAKLRMSKLSELIHKSSEYPDLDYARVTVFFQEIVDGPAAGAGAGAVPAGGGADESGDSYSVVPGSQFTVTRTVTRSNASDYFISGRKAPVSEVVALLKGKGIDLDNNRFLILQGEVELISQMKPKAPSAHEEGLLEYLEDIIGSNVYVEQIATSSLLLEQLSEQRNDKIKRVQQAERERASLEGSKAEAEALLSKEREIKRKQGVLLQKMLHDAGTDAAASEGRLAAASTALTAERDSLRSVTEAIAAVEKRLREASAAHETDALALAAAKKKMSDIEQQDVKLREDMKAAKAAQKQHEESLRREQARLEEAQKTISGAAAAIPVLSAAVARLQAERVREEAEHDVVMSSLKGETETLRKLLDAKQAELAPAAEAAALSAATLRTARAELQLARDSAEASSSNIAGLRAKEAVIKGDLLGRVAEKATLQAEIAASTTRRAAADKEAGSSSVLEAAATERAKAARARLDESRAALAAEGGSRGNSLVAQLMAAAKKGGPLAAAGLHGRLGDLGRIADQYDVAVTTACPALNWLVVDSTEGGQLCVDFLRSKNLGRAKFIILDKMGWAAGLMAKEAPASPEGVPRLFDLVTAKEERYRSAFYFALRDTVVAKDLDQATRVAFGGGQRWRVVTLGGEMVEVNGAMSGGGKQARKGGMSSAASPAVLSAEELAALESEAAAAATAVADVRARRSACLKEVADLDRALPKLAQRLSKLDLELAALGRMGDDVAAQTEAALTAPATASSAAAAADAKALLATLTAKMAQLEASHASVQTAAVRLDNEVSSLKRQVIEVGGEKVARAKARLDRVSEALDKASKDATKAKGDLKAAEKAAEKAGASAEKATAEARSAAVEYEKTKARLAPLEDEALGVVQVINAAREVAAASEAAVARLRGEVDESSRGVKALRAREADFAGQVGELEARLAQLKTRGATLRKQLDKVAEDYKAAMEELVADMSSLLAEDSEGDAAGASAASDADLSARVQAKINEPLALPALGAEALAAVAVDAVQAALAVLEGENRDLRKKANLGAILEFRAKEKEYLRRVAELEAVARAREEARRSFEGLRKQRLDTFMSGFSVITLRLKEMYQMITLGGDAELELVDSLDPFAEGIVFSVRPPKKSWKNISNLSGGEKTLSSLALVFALHHFKPTPLYVMDEIDAALDFKNVSIVANYIKERTKNAQFIIISLRNNMFELADRLVGIYKTRDVTKSITVSPRAVMLAAAASAAPGSEGV